MKMFKIYFFAFNLIYIINGITRRCFGRCDLISIKDAIIFYARLPRDETLIEKRKARPVVDSDYFVGYCSAAELNKALQCLGEDENHDISQEDMEACFLEGNKDFINCQNNHIGDLGLQRAWFCLLNLPEKRNTHYAFYHMVKNAKFFNQNNTNYNNNLNTVKQIWCQTVKDFYTDHPTTDKSKLIKNIYTYYKTENLFNKIAKFPYLQRQFKCIMVEFAYDQQESTNILSEICPDIMLSNFDSVNLVDKLFPISKKNKIVEETKNSDGDVVNQKKDSESLNGPSVSFNN